MRYTELEKVELKKDIFNNEDISEHKKHGILKAIDSGFHPHLVNEFIKEAKQEADETKKVRSMITRLKQGQKIILGVC